MRKQPTMFTTKVAIGKKVVEYFWVISVTRYLNTLPIPPPTAIHIKVLNIGKR